MESYKMKHLNELSNTNILKLLQEIQKVIAELYDSMSIKYFCCFFKSLRTEKLHANILNNIINKNDFTPRIKILKTLEKIVEFDADFSESTVMKKIQPMIMKYFSMTNSDLEKFSPKILTIPAGGFGPAATPLPYLVPQLKMGFRRTLQKIIYDYDQGQNFEEYAYGKNEKNSVCCIG